MSNLQPANHFNFTYRYTMVVGRSFDLFDTMERMLYFRETGTYAWDAATYNYESLGKIANGECRADECTWYDLRMRARGLPMTPVGFGVWFDQYGVRCDPELYHDQELVDATIAVEAAHYLWNLRQGEGVSGDPIDISNDGDSVSTHSITLSYADSDIEELLNEMVGEI